MSVKKTDSYCVGERHPSATTKFHGDIIFKGGKVLIGFRSICQIKSMILSDNTKQPEGLGDFFRNLRKKGLNVLKKMSKKPIKNPARALDITAHIATAAAFKNPKNV